jgi:hypothetical protein
MKTARKSVRLSGRSLDLFVIVKSTDSTVANPCSVAGVGDVPSSDFLSLVVNPVQDEFLELRRLFAIYARHSSWGTMFASQQLRHSLLLLCQILSHYYKYVNSWVGRENSETRSVQLFRLF